MSASFAKAVIPRSRREQDPRREPDWSLGWIMPENEMPTANPTTVSSPIPIVMLHDETSSNTAHD
jgi:hypothetical protein